MALPEAVEALLQPLASRGIKGCKAGDYASELKAEDYTSKSRSWEMILRRGDRGTKVEVSFQVRFRVVTIVGFTEAAENPQK